MQRSKKPRKCPIEGCQEMTPGGRLCSACKSWWWRVQLKTSNQLADYLHRLDRYAGRARRLHMGARKGAA